MNAVADHRPPLVRALLRPEAYPHPARAIGLAETHVSYLFFTDSTVYKVKKAVNYGFLDFTTLESRRFYCHEEVRLNSRISPDVYLGVVPICQQGDEYRVEGPGETVEYAVKMRRLPADRALDRLLRRGALQHQDVRRVAARIARFHREAPTSSEITAHGDLSVVRQNTEENFQQTLPWVGVCLSREEYDDIVAYTRAFEDVKAEVFQRRAREGRVRDGHGDLHAANIFLENGIEVIDCIEFNQRFRCLDVAQDMAFLAMDLDFYGRPDLSEAFVAAYIQESGDTGVRELLDFFKAYRAFVRGKVTSFRLRDASLSEDEHHEVTATARAYFRLAHACARKSLPRPLLVLVGGLMGTGKSYLGSQLAGRWDMEYISSDVTRKQLAGLRPTEHRYDPYGQGLYSPQMSRLTYEAMFREARRLLSAGRSVVLDATFSRRQGRLEALSMGRELGVEVWAVECVAPDEVVRARLVRRTETGEETASDGRAEMFDAQKASWEPMDEVPARQHVLLDTSGTREESLQALLLALFSRALASGP